MKKQFAFFSTLALVGWCIYRDKKYPLAKGYRLFNKVIFNGNMINNGTLKLANKILSHKKSPKVPQELIQRSNQNQNTRSTRNNFIYL